MTNEKRTIEITSETGTEKRTIEITRDVITVETDLDVPKGKEGLPIFAGQGWIDADVEHEGSEQRTLSIRDEETGAKLTVIQGVMGPIGRYNSAFTPLPEHNSYHIEQTGEMGNSGVGETAVAGDFYVDYRVDGKRWTGRQWVGGTPQLRVRFRSTVTDPTPRVVIKKPAENEVSEE